MPGQSAGAWSPRRTAASLIIKSLRSTAATAIGLERKASKSMPEVRSSLRAMASNMWPGKRRESLKDKDGFSLGPEPHRRFQHLAVAQIHRGHKHGGEFHFKTGFIE